ncbi:MAG: hypothetical protein MJ053_05500, partial [Elusimicrobiaceae bacterium]|nr:hypothetical protein [Elusimicrobiaceae bacterium]
MMLYLLLVCMMGWAAAEIMGRLTRRYAAWVQLTRLVAASGVVICAAGLLLTRLSLPFAFLHPWALILLLLPLGVVLAHSIGRRVFVRRIDYPLTHLNIEQASLRVLFTRWLALGLYALCL